MSVRLRNPLSLLVWAACLLPAPLDGTADRVLAGAVLLVGLMVNLSVPAPFETLAPARRAGFFFAFLTLLGALSYVYSTAFNGVLTGPLDWLELARPAALGVFAVHLIRHRDERLRGELDAALAVGLYAGSFYQPRSEYAVLATLALAWMLFFSRARLRLVHAFSAALLLLVLGGRTAWAAGLLVLAAALAAAVYRSLARGSGGGALPLTVLFFVLLASVPVAVLRSAGVPAAPAAAAREASASEALRYARRSPLLGWGPARYEPAGSVPDQYLSWALRGGLLGLGAALIGLLMAAWGLASSAGGDMRRLLGIAAFLGAGALLLLSGRFLESFRLCLLAGFVAECARGGSGGGE